MPEPVAPLPPALFELVRVAILPEGAFGVLKHAGMPFAVTLEHTYPFAGGRQMLKVPPGRHRCIPTWFHRGSYRTFEIIVEGHSRLLFHRGNLEADADGCILIAESFGLLRGQSGILDSSNGFAEFMRLAGSHAFDLAVGEWQP